MFSKISPTKALENHLKGVLDHIDYLEDQKTELLQRLEDTSKDLVEYIELSKELQQAIKLLTQD